MSSPFNSAQGSELKEGTVDWPVEHEARTNEKPFNGPIPEGDWNPRKMSNSVLFPCPSAGWGEHLGRGSVQIESQKPVVLQRRQRWEISTVISSFGNKRHLLGGSCLSLCTCLCVFEHRCTCMCICAPEYVHTYAHVLPCLASSGTFNIF